MKKKVVLFILAITLSIPMFSLEKEVILNTKTGELCGTMIYPMNSTNDLAVLFISGSGPTDRNGNNPQMINNSIKFLAESLCADAGVPSLRYDKRGIVKSVDAGLSECDLRFSTFVEDASAWVDKLHEEYQKIVIIGHSEGALIATLVANQNKNVSALVLLAGAGRSADLILKEQLSKGSPVDQYFIYTIIDRLKAGDEVKDVPKAYSMLFRESVQPYLISWFAIDPCAELSTVKVPTLIVQGDMDIQIKVDDAKMLHQAQPNAQLIIVENMNHVFKECKSKKLSDQLPTYSNPQLSNSPQLTTAIIEFLNNLQ